MLILKMNYAYTEMDNWNISYKIALLLHILNVKILFSM